MSPKQKMVLSFGSSLLLKHQFLVIQGAGFLLKPEEERLRAQAG